MRRPKIPSFKYAPLRGIYAEIARELHTTRQSVKQQAHKGHARILALIAEKIAQRKQQHT